MTFRARRARFAARRFDLRVRIAHRGEPSNSGGPAKRIASLLTVAAVVGCSDAFKPTTDNVLGAYRVQTFQTTDTSGTIDWVQRGGTLTITLGTFGTTTGHLFLPGAAAGGGDVDQLLIGDWTLAGNTITFSMPAIDTFVRDMPWTVTENQLSGDHTFGGTRVKVVLAK